VQISFGGASIYLNQRETIQNGASLLDNHMPNWYDKIDLEKLDMFSCEHCILGQLYGTFHAGYDKLFGIKSRQSTLHFGPTVLFGFSALDRETAIEYWAEEIQTRKLNAGRAVTKLVGNYLTEIVSKKK